MQQKHPPFSSRFLAIVRLVTRAIIPLLLFLGTQADDAFAQSVKEMSVEERQTALENLHKRLYALPLSQDFIYQELMPNVREERKAVAPNFPQRGRTEEETRSNLSSWLKNHPDELDAYSKFIEKKIAHYSKSNSRK